MRPFLKQGARALAIPSLEKVAPAAPHASWKQSSHRKAPLPPLPYCQVVAALDTIGDADSRWRSRNLLTLALCYDEVGQADKAAPLLTTALTLAKEVQADTAAKNVEEVRCVSIHVARNGGGAAKVSASALSDAQADEGSRGTHMLQLQEMLSAGEAPEEAKLLAILEKEDPIGYNGYRETVDPNAEIEEPSEEVRLKHVSSSEGQGVATVTDQPPPTPIAG